MSSHRRRRVVLAVVVLVFCWAAVAAFSLIRGLLDADHGIRAVHSAQARETTSAITSPQTVDLLRRARADFASSRAELGSWWLRPLAVIPVVDRQFDSVRDLATAAEQVSGVGADSLDRVRRLLQAADPGGSDRVALLDQLSMLARSTYAGLSRVDTGPATGLLGPLGRRHHQFTDELDRARSEVLRAADAASAVSTILQGPQRYLVLMGNNAEMRAGSGMFLEAGVLSTEQGTMTLSDVQPTAQLALATGGVTVGGDLEARWGWLDPGVDWRNLGLTPDFTVDGPLAADMWHAETGQEVDGVLAVDVATLEDVLSVTGPVEVGGSSVSASNVEQFLMHDQYEDLSYGSTTAEATQAQADREEALGTLAGAAFSALQDRSVGLHPLSEAMATAAQGRHLLVWSADASKESTWVALGVAGLLTSQSMAVDLLNQGGNKLDQYVTVRVVLAVNARQPRRGELTVDVANHTPPGQSSFIAGPYPGLDTAYGQYVGTLAVNLPAGVKPYVVGNPDLDALGPEGPTDLVGIPVSVLPGATQQVEIDLVLPDHPLDSTVVPSARIPPVSWTTLGVSHTDSQPFSFRW